MKKNKKSIWNRAKKWIGWKDIDARIDGLILAYTLSEKIQRLHTSQIKSIFVRINSLESNADKLSKDIDARIRKLELSRCVASSTVTVLCEQVGRNTIGVEVMADRMRRLEASCATQEPLRARMDDQLRATMQRVATLDSAPEPHPTKTQGPITTDEMHAALEALLRPPGTAGSKKTGC